ncbi:MAG TPA: DUF4388 domain-containing protein [Ktedonobacteraceae bacterium]|jgi:hypothetical protein|nr:DUF4388 domain-containing protein [Ktedonobacteraceae bacterium]
MANERAVTAENLSEVLEQARLRRQTGHLSIVLPAGNRVQEGELYLQDGRPVYARIGQMVGQEALNRLLLWRNVQITFRADTTGMSPYAPGNPFRNNASLSFPTPSRVAVHSPAIEAHDGGGNNMPRNAPSTLGVEWLVPQKRGEEREVLSLPLTRRQRFIYFLVDGKRTVADLARCTGKNIQEIELILQELQTQGLVAF